MFQLIKAASFLLFITTLSAPLAAQSVQPNKPASGKPESSASDKTGQERGSEEKFIPLEQQRALGLLDAQRVQVDGVHRFLPRTDGWRSAEGTEWRR